MQIREITNFLVWVIKLTVGMPASPFVYRNNLIKMWVEGPEWKFVVGEVIRVVVGREEVISSTEPTSKWWTKRLAAKSTASTVSTGETSRNSRTRPFVLEAGKGKQSVIHAWWEFKLHKMDGSGVPIFTGCSMSGHKHSFVLFAFCKKSMLAPYFFPSV